MKKVVLINTVKPVTLSFEKKLKERMPDLDVSNILDEHIAKELNKKDGFEEEDYMRLLALIKLAESTKPDLILATCSSLSMAIEELKQFISVPIYKIDENMLTMAVESDKKITILATADSTIGPTKSHLESIARDKAKDINVEYKVVGPAYEAMKQGDIELHDKMLLEEASNLKDAELIILAQASMSHLQERMEELCKCQVLSSINSAVDLIVEVLS
ncbi:MAG: Asp/Glu racemase [Epulopiscium sp.]|nr:Asp/Glu racemase [Candidatus Epulonipiscium sp.]